MEKEKIVVASFQSLNKHTAAGIAKLGYLLSAKLDERNALDSFIISSKGKFRTPFRSKPVSSWSRYYLFVLNSISKRIGLPAHISRYVQELLYDRFCSNHLNSSVTKLIVTTPYLFRTFKKARRLGIPIYFIPGNPEDNFIATLVKEENARYNITGDDPYTYYRRLNYYNKSVPLIDKIVTYSSVMESSYSNAGFQDKIISMRGYLKPELSEEQTQRSKGKFKVAFLAYTVLLKGLQYVLEAWKELDGYDMELHIGGIIDRNVQHLIDTGYSHLKNVFYHGLITDVPKFFSDKSLYVLSSIIDGAPVSVLEAMNSRLPVIISENCGTKDIIEEGKSGWIVPNRNAEAIRERILEAYEHQEKTEQMGAYAHHVLAAYDKEPFIRDLAALAIGEDCKQMVNEREIL